MVKVMWHKAVSQPQTDGSFVFARLRQCVLLPSHEGTLAPPTEHNWTCASFCPPESITQTASRSGQSFMHRSRQTVPVLYNGHLPPKIAHSHGGSGPPSNTLFNGPTRVHNPNGISIGSAVFSPFTAERSYTLNWAAPFPKNAHLYGWIWTPSNTWFLGSNRILNPNSILIGSAIFAGLTTVIPLFTRYNRLSAGCQTWQPCWTNSCSFNRMSNRVVQPGWQPAVYTIQPVVKPVVKRVWQPVECLYTRCNRLSNRFDNRLTTGQVVWR